MTAVPKQAGCRQAQGAWRQLHFRLVPGMNAYACDDSCHVQLTMYLLDVVYGAGGGGGSVIPGLHQALTCMGNVSGKPTNRLAQVYLCWAMGGEGDMCLTKKIVEWFTWSLGRVQGT